MPDDQDFEVAFDHLFARAYRHALRLVGDRALAEDLASEALARTYRHWRRVAAYEHLDAWVLRVVTNLAIDAQARGDARQRVAAPSSPEDGVLLRLTLAQALRALPARQRDAVVLRYLVDMTEADVATATEATTTPATTPGVPPTTATAPATAPVTNPPVTVSPDPTTTTMLVCHNSYNPACGPLVYDPPFTNEPATVRLTKQPAAPVVGETVTLTMHITDPDNGKFAAIQGCYPYGTFGDGTSSQLPACVADCAPTTPRHGVWDAPKTEPADLTYTFRHAYTKAGEYTAEFSFGLAQCEPWSSFAHKTTKIVVAPS